MGTLQQHCHPEGNAIHIDLLDADKHTRRELWNMIRKDLQRPKATAKTVWENLHRRGIAAIAATETISRKTYTLYADGIPQ